MRREKTLLLFSLGLFTVLLSVFYFGKFILAQTSNKKVLGTIIQGRVLSPYGPVENARVRVAGDENYTLTDRQGRYVLQTQYPPVLRLRVTAGKQGWFNNVQITSNASPDTDIFMNPIYLNDQPGYRFISPETCSRCHIKLTRYWDQSKMAHTTSSPKVLDMYNGTDAFNRKGVDPGYRLENPNSNGNCAECHAPSAVAYGRWSQNLNSVLQSSRSEWDGISCDYCHKIRKVIRDKNKASGMGAVLERQSASGSPSILVFGPYDDVVVPPMAASYNSVYEQGQFCSVCHSHSKKLNGGKTWRYQKVYSTSEWNGFGLENNTFMPIQTTYQEWKMWQDQLTADDPNKGKKCQDCHLSWRKEMLPYDNYVVDKGARNMWGTHRSPKKIHPHHFDGGTQTQLKTALAMELEGEITGNRLNISVYVTNTNGGHWVPTGETMRSVMLLLQATDSRGEPLKMIKGKRMPEWTGVGEREAGNYAGLPGAVFARVLGDDNGNLHVPFWRATRIVADTRIRAKDTVTFKYQFALDDPDDEPTVEAKLIYRPVIKPLAEKKSWAVEDILITSSVW